MRYSLAWYICISLSRQDRTLVHRFQNNRPYLAFVPSPTERFPLSPPPRPRFALLPRPLPGARAVMAISRGKSCSGSGADAGFPGERESGPESGSSPGSPHALDRGGYCHGGGTDGEGRAPSPVSASCLQRPDSIPTDCHPPVTPSPPAGTRTFLLKAPAPGGGQYVGIPGTSRLLGGKPPDGVKKDQYSPPVGLPVIGIRCTSES
jgi:hypothetical protein